MLLDAVLATVGSLTNGEAVLSLLVAKISWCSLPTDLAQPTRQSAATSVFGTCIVVTPQASIVRTTDM